MWRSAWVSLDVPDSFHNSLCDHLHVLMSSATDITRQVRQILEESSDAPSLQHIIDTIDDSTSEWATPSSPQARSLLTSLEDLYHQVLDHAVFHQVEVFLTVLYHLRVVIPVGLIVSTWFDLVLRPALREPKLSTATVGFAKKLVLVGLVTIDEENTNKTKDFRRRLLDLYLLDAPSESSGEDALEWAELDKVSREKRECWKSNLEDVLITFGMKCPQDLMSEVFRCFSSTSARLQLLIFLNNYSSHPDFPPHSKVLANHPLLDSLVLSLELDRSSTACAVGLTLISKLLPILAVHAPNALISRLPQFISILARVSSWHTGAPQDVIEDETLILPEVNPDLHWQSLIFTFNLAAFAPEMDRYFCHLYYLFPWNLVKFAREPVEYVEQSGFECPYTAGWTAVLNKAAIRTRIEALFANHILHPAFLTVGDPDTELAQPFWIGYELSRVVGECTMLNARNVRIGAQQEDTDDASGETPRMAVGTLSKSTTGMSSHPAGEPPRGRFRVPLRKIVATSVALKSGMAIEIDCGEPQVAWPDLLFFDPPGSPGKHSISLPPEGGDKEIPDHVAEAIAALQRKLILMNNELNCELWLARRNVEHIGRLKKECELAKSAEGERQGLHNKLREYKSEVARLQKELKDHKEQAFSMKNKYAQWNAELQGKLRDFREQKRNWTLEVAALQASDAQHKTAFEAQGRLLGNANRKIFELETKIKETAHKVDRLRDYERQIEQLVQMQKHWEMDARKLSEQTELLNKMQGDCQGMKLLIKSYEESLKAVRTEAKERSDRADRLEAELAIVRQGEGKGTEEKLQSIIKSRDDYVAQVLKANEHLRGSNEGLRGEIEELKEMVEILKAQGSSRSVNE